MAKSFALVTPDELEDLQRTVADWLGRHRYAGSIAHHYSIYEAIDDTVEVAKFGPHAFEITSEWLHANGASGVGWSAEQLNILGVCAFEKGWLRRLVGRLITPRQKELFERAHRKRETKRYRAILEQAHSDVEPS